MVDYFIDFAIVVGLVIGITALNGVITNGVGTALIGRKKKSEYVDQSSRVQIGWKEIGGKRK